jgi:hypothetical protein
MTTPTPTRIPLQDFLDGLAIEEEVERLSKMTAEQIFDELKADGIDPERGRAAVWRALGKGDAQGGGAPPAAAPAPTSKVGSVATKRERRGGRMIPIALAIAVGVAAFVAVERKEIQAWLFPGPTAPVPSVPSTPEETPQDKAARLREEAYVNVRKGYLGDALDQLDEAATLDPMGDKADKVLYARQFIDEFKHKPTQYGGGWAKPPVGPGERPLRRTP